MNARPTIVNVSMTLASTEYSYSLPAGTKRFSFKLRDAGADCQVAFVQGESGTTYVNLPGGRTYSESEIKGGGNVLRFRSASAGQTAEILSWV